MTKWNCLTNQTFANDHYAISPITPLDIESIRRWRNAQLEVLRQKEPITESGQISYFNQHIWPTMPLAEPPNILMGLRRNDRLIGYGGLVHIAWEHRRAELSFLLDDRRASNEAGYTEDFLGFLSLIRKLAFDDLKLHRLFTETYALRTHHITVLESFGLRLEGVMRDHVRIGGDYVHSLIHGMIASNE